MKRPNSATQNLRKLYMNYQQKNFIPPSCLPNLENMYETHNYIKEEALEEELSLLQNSWDELGITPQYRSVFLNIISQANEAEKINIFSQEKNNIKKLRESLLGLKKEIENRENNLTQLKSFNALVQNIINSGDDVNSINQVLQNVINLIKTLRINAINIVSKIIKVNQIIAYYSTSGKFDISRIKPEYSYDSKYLFKMRDDLKFLKNSALSTFIEMNNTNIDPFLTNCAPVQNGIKSNKRVIPITDDIMKLITYSRYELLQETVLDNIEKDNKKIDSKINLKLSDSMDMKLYKNLNNKNLLNKLEKEKFKLKFRSSFNGSNNYKQNLNAKNSFIYSTRGHNISRYLHNLKNTDKIKYDSYFYKKRNNSPLTVKKRFGSKLKKNENISHQNKIIIIHEEIESLKHEQFMKRLGSIQNLDYNENEKIPEKNEEKPIDYNINENMENIENKNLKNEIIELKTKLRNCELIAKNEKEIRENLEKKNNHIMTKAKEYQNELEQISQRKKKKENELNNKISLLQKEIENIRSDKMKNIQNGEYLIEKIKTLENKIQTEENLRKDKENNIEILEQKLEKEKNEYNMAYNKLNEEKNIIEKNITLAEDNMKKINEEKNILIEENQKLKDDIKNLEESKREQDNIIKEKEKIINEKEEENQKIIADKIILESEKLSAKNELEKIKEENETQKSQYEKMKEEFQEQKNDMEKMKEEYKKQNDELNKLKEKIKLLEKNKEILEVEIEEKNKTIKENELLLKNKEDTNVNNNKMINDYYNININTKPGDKLISLEEQINYKPEKIENNLKESNNNENDEIYNNNFQLKDDKKNNLININYTNSNENTIKHEQMINNDNNNINILKNALNNDIKEEIQTTDKNYIVDYYRENIFNLLTELSETIPLEDIPDFLKRAFAIDDSVFSDKFYFKGIFPKIIISKNLQENNKITGMCSFYYESTEDLNDNLTLRINSIIVAQNYEEQIKEMINFIKNNVEFDKIMIYILYDKVDNKFLANKEAKELFENKLKFKWFCVVRDEKLKQRYIKYAFSKKIENYDPNINETTLAFNALKKNKNNFLMNNLAITSINTEENMNLIKEKFGNKFSYNKFMNPNLVYFLLLNNKKIISNFSEKISSDELKKIMEKIMKYTTIENNYGINTIEGEKHFDEEIENSIYKEISEYLMSKDINCVPNFFKTKLSINFETNYSTIIDNMYYNRISSDKINIFEEEKSGSRFFLIPSKDNNTLFYISEINNKLKDMLIDGKENIYEKFLEFQPTAQKQIFEFSVKSIRDISYIPRTPRNNIKTIYIPCFSIKTHLFTYNFKEINNNVIIREKETDTPLNISSTEEFINVEFKPDNNIQNSFSTIEGYDLIINNSFIMGIFDNDIINNTKLPLLQFLYISKDNFLSNDNYILSKND